MNKYFRLFLFIVSLHSTCLAQEVWTIGPMIHYSFGGEKRHFSYGIEGAYWNLKHFYYSYDAGIELSKKRVRIYGEVQTGIGVTGISAGPVIEYNKEERKLRAGFQTTAWANYFLGFDYRYRRIDKTNFHCVGTYLKVPFATKDMKSSSAGNHYDWDD